jgi:L-malate glycosyltransferase
MTSSNSPRLPRLLLVANFLSASGGSSSVMEDLADRLQVSATRILRVSSYRSGLLRGLHMLSAAAFQRGEYDLAVVDLYSGRAFLWGEALSYLLSTLRCPFVLVLRGGALPDLAQHFPRRMKKCLAKAAAVTVPSPFLLEQMRPYHDNLILLPNPLDLERYRFTLRVRPQPRLMWLRSLHEIYNPMMAPIVAASLVKDFPDVTLTMVGPDKGDGSWQNVERVSAELGIAHRVIMPGGVAKTSVPTWLNKGDIFLNTTNVDNTPVSVLEAMACGLCVVSTDIGGIPYLLEHERDALLVPPNDPRAMTTAVIRLLTEPGLSQKLSQSARRTAEQYDWPAILPQWEKTLQRISSNRH